MQKHLMPLSLLFKSDALSFGWTSWHNSCRHYLVLKINNELVLRLADVEDEKTAPEIQRLFEEFLTAAIVDNDDMIVRNLSVADESSNAIYQYDYNSYPEELGLFKSFRLKTAIKTKKFNFHTDDLGSLFGYIIYLGSMEKGIVLFKKHYPISLIKRGSLLLGAKKKAERFEKLPGVDIIRMNGDAQLLRLGDTIFVLDLKMLERNMGFSTLIQQAAVETVSAIEDLDILDDIEVLRDTLEVPSFARKLSKVKKASPIFKLGISKEAIVEFTKNTPELAGKFKYSEDGTQIRLGTKKSKIAFLKLMNDAFLHSELTKQWYDASAKDNITQGAG